MIIYQIKQKTAWISLNRLDKHNAFNEDLLTNLSQAIQDALEDPEVQTLILSAHGRFFSAGADLNSMQQAAKRSQTDNEAQALQLAKTISLWHQSPKPTLCIVQGPAFGGALGFIAASDYVIASPDAKFCFSEAKLGLIPAVISPYILQVLGFKMTKRLFLSAEQFNAHSAQSYGLVDEIVENDQLISQAENYIQAWLSYPSATLSCIKTWLTEIYQEPIDAHLIEKTAKKLAEVRMTKEAQQGLMRFLNAKTLQGR
jgi:methylglutaconyl-CoA hydratase